MTRPVYDATADRGHWTLARNGAPIASRGSSPYAQADAVVRFVADYNELLADLEESERTNALMAAYIEAHKASGRLPDAPGLPDDPPASG